MHSISTWLLRISNRLSGSESVVSCTQQLQDKLSVTTMAAYSKSPTFPMFVRWSLKQILKRIFYADGLTHTIWKALLLVNANNEVLLPKSNACMNWIERKVLLSHWDWALCKQSWHSHWSVVSQAMIQLVDRTLLCHLTWNSPEASSRIPIQHSLLIHRIPLIFQNKHQIDSCQFLIHT